MGANITSSPVVASLQGGHKACIMLTLRYISTSLLEINGACPKRNNGTATSVAN